MRFLFSWFLLTSALTAGHFTGVVIDGKSGTPLASVSVKPDTGDITWTDSNGRFHIESDLESPTVQLQLPNYWNGYFILAAETENILSLDPFLYDFDGIQVSGTRQTPGKLNTSIQPLTIQMENHSPIASTGRILQSMPGISLKSYGGPGGISIMSLHGGQGDRVAVLLDGIQINSEQNGSADISRIPSLLLDEIELYPYGLSSRLGSSAMTGAVNFNLEDDPNRFIASTGSYGMVKSAMFVTIPLGHVTLGTAAGLSRYFGNFGYTEDGDYNSIFSGIHYTGFRNTKDQGFIYLWLKGLIPPGLPIRMSLIHLGTEREMAGPIYYLPYSSHMEDQLDLLSLETGGRSWLLRSSLKQDALNYQKPASAGPAIHSDSELSTWRNQFSVKKGRHTVVIEHIFSSNSSWSTSLGQLSRIDTSRWSMALSNTAVLEWQRVTIQFSGRVEWQERRRLNWAAGLDIRFHLFDRQTEHSFSFSRNYKIPTFNDLFWEPFGDPNLKTEFSRNLYFRNRFLVFGQQFTLNTFYIRYDDLIQWTPQTGAAGLWRPENVRAGESYGYHAALRSAQRFGWSVLLSADRNITRNYDEGIASEHYGKPFLYSPEHLYSAQLDGEFSHMDCHLQYRYESERTRLYAQQDYQLPSYRLWDVSVSGRIVCNQIQVKATVSIENLLNEKYQTVLGYIEPDRSYGLTIEFKSLEGNRE